MKDVNGSTPLHLSSLEGNIEIVSYLLENNATVDPINRNGSTPLIMASLNGAYFSEKCHFSIVLKRMRYVLGHLDAAELLVNKSANVSVQNYQGFAPIHFAGISIKDFRFSCFSKFYLSILQLQGAI